MSMDIRSNRSGFHAGTAAQCTPVLFIDWRIVPMVMDLCYGPPAMPLAADGWYYVIQIVKTYVSNTRFREENAQKLHSTRFMILHLLTHFQFLASLVELQYWPGAGQLLFLQFIFTARRSYASAVFGIVILFVRLSHACFVTKRWNILSIFWYHMKA